MKHTVCAWVGALFVLGALASYGQVTTGAFLGIVYDASGAVVPNANVTVKNVDTGISRTTTTDTAGRYTAPQLSPGSYEVSVEVTGFQTLRHAGLQLAVGQQATVNFTLQVGTVAEQVTVTGEAPLVEATTSSVGGLVSQTQMRDLPLNARSYEQLATLQPNVYQQRNVKPSTNTGYTPRISAAGMRASYNAFVVDGIDIMDTTGNSPGSAAGQLLGVETLREFRVVTNNYNAQYGRAVGAIIDVVSRGGTNEFHGTVFEFLRNDKVDARNFFDVAKAPLRRNQFGGVLGGPIAKDRTFFFGSYEALRTRAGTTQIFYVPTEQAKKGILPDPKDPSKTITIPVHPDMPTYLKYYPTPQEDIGGGVGKFSYLFEGRTREDYLTGRLDYQRSQDVSYFGRYTYDYTDLAQPRIPGVLPPWAERLVSRNQILTLSEMRIINPSLINEFRAGFVRYTPRSMIKLNGPDPQLQFPGTYGAATWVVSGSVQIGTTLATMGNSATRPFERQYGNTFQLTDNLSYAAGSHSLKTGINLERFQDNIGSLTPGQELYSYKTQYTFQSLTDLLQGNARSFTGQLTPSAIGISGRQWLFGVYLQDDWRWLPNFTLNLGLRHEFASRYSNVHNRFLYMRDLNGTALTGQKYPYGGRTCARCLEPRFGFAWDVFSNGKTALKGGFGMFHAQVVRVQAYYPPGYAANTPGGVIISADNPSFPNPTIPKSNSVIRINETGDPKSVGRLLALVPKTPTALQWNLTLDQQLTPTTVLRLAYIGSHGYNLDGGYEVNTNTYQVLSDGSFYFSPGVHRIRPDLGAVFQFANDYNSYYNALSVTLGQRMTHGIAVETSYAFSRSTDDTTIQGIMPAHLLNEVYLLDGRRNVHHGLSGLDMRHRGIVNFSYDVPALRSPGAFANKLLSGWQVNSIITLQGGNPLTPLVGFDRANSRGSSPANAQRPNLSPSLNGPVPICPCTIGGVKQEAPQRYFDPTVFGLPATGTYGNAGRNIIIGPGLINFDFALVKKTALTERLELQFRFEGFNMFNNVNFGMPSMIVFSTTGAIVPTAGMIANTSTDSRQLQLAMKLLF